MNDVSNCQVIMFMKKCKILFVTGCGFIFLSLLIAAIRSHLIDFFDNSVEHTYIVPAGKMFVSEEDNFTFAAISDTGGENAPLEKIINQARGRGAKFILHLGDLVRYKTPSHFDWIVSELEGKLKGLPFYMIPGNHEIETEEGVVDKTAYMEIFGQTYYWFGYGNTLFIGLDSSEGMIDKEQFHWLKLTLEKIRLHFKYCIIYSHVPPTSGMKIIDKHLLPEDSRKFASLVSEHNVTLLLFGHVHYFSREMFAGVPMYTLPASGQESRDMARIKPGYLMISVTPEGVAEVKTKYLHKIGSTERFESFLSHALVKKEIRYISLWLLAVGTGLVLIAWFMKKYRS